MNKITSHNLIQLKTHYGNWNAVAAALGMEARSLRHVRRNMSKPAKHLIALKAKQLRLVRLIAHLIQSGVVTRAEVRCAWVEANKILQPSKQDAKKEEFTQ